MQVESQTKTMGTTIVLQTHCTTATMCATIAVSYTQLRSKLAKHRKLSWDMTHQLGLDQLHVCGACIASTCEHVDIRCPRHSHNLHALDPQQSLRQICPQ